MKVLLPTPACFERTDLFVPDPETRDSKATLQEASAMCAVCPFRVECAAQGLRAEDRHSIRAGVRMWRKGADTKLRAIIDAETP